MDVSVMPLNFVLDNVVGNPNADWLTIASKAPSKVPHPSSLKQCKEKGTVPKPVNHLKHYEKRYTILQRGSVRARKGLIGDKEATEKWVAENADVRQAEDQEPGRNFDRLHRNLLQLLVNNVSWQTLGLVPTSPENQKTAKINLLKRYRLDEVVVGMVCKETVRNTASGIALLDALWRQILCSNELGLHWSRTDPARRQFRWLLAAEL